MREPLLEDSFSHPAYSSESEKAPQVERRQFLKTAGLAGVSLALAPRVALAQSSDMARWRDRVTGFVYTVCSDSRARAITSLLYSARIEWAPRTRDFHYYYAAPLIFVGTTISPEEVICGNGFEVNQFPFYDERCPCGSIADLNAFEIRRVTNASEINYYGCVLAPASRRLPLEYADHANYRRTASKLYDMDPDQFKPEYKRVFRGKGRAVYGYQVAHKTQVGSNGKPLKDVLLDSNDI
ncbi:MAG: twin-arginine translocation signal domain-containing protein [Acidobacteriota bacterium]|nr:twin-arginine translocation signal domain-containing protein [Acidobacteriota bacterium]